MLKQTAPNWRPSATKGRRLTLTEPRRAGRDDDVGGLAGLLGESQGAWPGGSGPEEPNLKPRPCLLWQPLQTMEADTDQEGQALPPAATLPSAADLLGGEDATGQLRVEHHAGGEPPGLLGAAQEEDPDYEEGSDGAAKSDSDT